MQILGWLWCGRWLWLPHLGLRFHGLLEDGVELLFIQGKALEGAARGLHRLGNEGFWDFEFHFLVKRPFLSRLGSWVFFLAIVHLLESRYTPTNTAPSPRPATPIPTPPTAVSRVGWLTSWKADLISTVKR